MSKDIGHNLELTEIKIWPVSEPNASRVKAMASLTFNDRMRASGCRIIEGAKGLFLSFPSGKRPGKDGWVSVSDPTEREASNAIQEAVVERYKELRSTTGAEP